MVGCFFLSSSHPCQHTNHKCTQTQRKAVILSTSRLQARRTLRALGQDPGARIRHLQEEEDGVVERKKSRRHLQEEEEGDEVVEGGKSRRLQEEDGVVEGPDGEMLQGDSEGWGAVMAAFLQQEAGLEGVRAVGVGFERSVYIPPYDTEARSVMDGWMWVC